MAVINLIKCVKLEGTRLRQTLSLERQGGSFQGKGKAKKVVFGCDQHDTEISMRGSPGKISGMPDKNRKYTFSSGVRKDKRRLNGI